MLKKRTYTFPGLLITLGSFVITAGLLYFVGHFFTVPFLMFSFNFTNDATGFLLSAGGSFIPIIAGLIVSYIAERRYIQISN